MSDAAGQRIAGFSRIAWIVGAVVIIGISAVVFPRLYQTPDGGIVVEGGQDYGDDVSPWFQDDPAELSLADGSIAGIAGGGYLELTPDAPPFTVSLASEVDDFIVARQSVGEWDADDYTGIADLGYLFDDDDIAYVVPGPEGGRLWLDGDTADWRVAVTELETRALEGTAEGSGAGMLLYTGDALSARFEHDGPGIFRVTVVAPGEDVRLAVNDVDEVSTRASWQNSGTVLLVIDSPGAGSWRVAVDE